MFTTPPSQRSPAFPPLSSRSSALFRDISLRGYDERDFRRLRELGCGLLAKPDELAGIVDQYGYLAEWKQSYVIQSVRASIHSAKITCIDSAILTYGLLEIFFPPVKRRLLAIHRRDPARDEECGHCVTLFWNDHGKVGAFSKSSFAGLGHRAATFEDEHAVAASYAKAYLKMGFEPLYFGVTTLEEAAPDVDWRFDDRPLNVLSERLQAKYEYAFMLPG
jgi:hypothetical protein